MSEASADAMRQLATPGPEHARLEPFVGTFRAVVKMWMGPGEPMVSTGTMTNTWVLGGRFLHQEYKADPVREMHPLPGFEGFGYWGYNRATRQYEGFWIDTASTIMQTEFGSVDEDGRVWTMTGEMTHQPDQTVRKRTVIRVEDRDHHSMETFFIVEDREAKGMEIRYTRE